MSEITVDGEEVTFTGEVPVAARQVFELLMVTLSEQRRAVTVFRVDDVDLLTEPDKVPEEGYSRIEAESLTHDELTLHLAREALSTQGDLAEELRAYARNILLLGWSEVFRRMDEFIGKIQTFADLLDNLGTFARAYSPPWREKHEELGTEQTTCLQRILVCFEAGDVAGLSDEVATGFVPIYERMRKFLVEETIPDLERSAASLQS